MVSTLDHVEQLVASGAFESPDSVIHAALDALFRQRPELQLRVLARSYNQGTLSIGQIAEELGISIAEALIRLRIIGVQIPLGGLTKAEIMDDIAHA